ARPAVLRPGHGRAGRRGRRPGGARRRRPHRRRAARRRAGRRDRCRDARHDLLQPGAALRRRDVRARPRGCRGSGPDHAGPHPRRGRRVGRRRRRARARQGLPRRSELDTRAAGADRGREPRVRLRRLDDGRHGGARHGRRARRGARGAHACSGGRARVPGHRRLARRARDRGGRLRRRRHRRLRRGARAGQRPRPRRPRGARGPGGPAARRRRESGCGMTTAGGIPSPPVGTWYLGPLPIRAYAFAILAGIVVAAWISIRRYRARGGPEGVVLDAVMWAVPFGIVGARIYHVLSSPDRYFGPDGNIAYALRIWEGGLGIWGAIPAGALGAWIALRRAGVRMAPFADALAPALLVAQAIGRLGNYFNQELFGSPTTLPWGLQIDQAH